jgi:hypothetical protein
MNFWVVRDEFCSAAANLKVPVEPPTSMLVSALQKYPPKPDVAEQYFEYLSMRSSGKQFQPEEVEVLSSTPFVPISDTKLVAPNKCYLGQPSSEFYRQLFPFVEFCDHAQPFLLMCGSKREPTMDDLGIALAQDPERFRRLAGGLSE